MNIHFAFILLFILGFQSSIFGQSKTTGPVIKNYGKVWKVENPDFKIDTTKEYKVVFDVANSPKSHEEVNAYLETAARFLNMHVQSGVAASQLKVAMVIHGQASKDVIADQGYQKRYNSTNPNQKLIEKLLEVGVQVILCGQSAASRDIAREELIENVQLSLSAMTALIQLQDKNYRLIKF